MDARPVGLDLTPVALLGAGIGEQPRLERGGSNRSMPPRVTTCSRLSKSATAGADEVIE
jgi:hypothetical protein